VENTTFIVRMIVSKRNRVTAVRCTGNSKIFILDI